MKRSFTLEWLTEAMLPKEQVGERPNLDIIPGNTKVGMSEENKKLIRFITSLEPHADEIIRRYKAQIDPNPCVGWLAMACELANQKKKKNGP